MRILISNDDGIDGAGLAALAEVAVTLGEVLVVAPDRQRSAASHSISIRSRLYAEEVNLFIPGVRAFQISGTPVDCVKWACVHLAPFDCMLSGINEGANLAADVLYSGTVAAAGEAALQGIPSIALSLCGPPYDFFSAAERVLPVLDTLVKEGFPRDSFLNINIPSDETRGSEFFITELGARSYRDSFVQKEDDAGRTYYRYTGEEVEETVGDRKDVLAVRDGYISVTPMRYQFTHFDWFTRLTRTVENSDV
jgi:5'-nucleotidase